MLTAILRPRQRHRQQLDKDADNSFSTITNQTRRDKSDPGGKLRVIEIFLYKEHLLIRKTQAVGLKLVFNYLFFLFCFMLLMRHFRVDRLYSLIVHDS